MPDPTDQHDAHKVLDDLRDHLARHDKPVAFLFGAGTSCSVAVPDPTTLGSLKPLIPAVVGLTALAKTDAGVLGARFTEAWDLVAAACVAEGKDANVENVLSRLRTMVSATGVSDKLAGLDRTELVQLEASVRTTIARAVSPGLDGLATTIPHRKFAGWLAKSSRRAPIEIFTVNYDVLFEHALECERVPVFDGFVGSYRPYFHADSLRRAESAPGAAWTRLWKMHGSVNWRRIVQDGRERIIRDLPNLEGELIYPSSQKYDESRQQPFSAFSERLSRFLDQDDALLVVAGFNFGDDHINNLIFGALENRPRTHVFALQFAEPEEQSDLAKRAAKRTNIIVAGPKTGIVGSRRATWNASTGPSHMSEMFGVTEEPDAEGQQVQVGKLNIGDFAHLCDFLQSMTAN